MKVLYALALLPFVASAGNHPGHPQKGNQEQYQRQSQKQEQSQNQSQSANNEGVSQNVEDTRQAPPVLAPSISASAPCYHGASGGVSVPGFGASGGKMRLDEGCEKRENDRLAIEKARAFMQLGRNDIALRVLCEGMECPSEPVKPAACPDVADRVVKACTEK